MSAAMISRIVSLIPERVARVQSGAGFHSTESPSRYPERVSHLAQFLSWLSPLNAISKDDQHILGLLHANGRPVHANEMEEESAELGLEDGGADALEYVEAETAAGAAEAALLPEEQVLVPREEALV